MNILSILETNFNKLEPIFDYEIYELGYTDLDIKIGDDTYGMDKEHGEFTSCGECWQKTGVYGTFNKKHDLDICKKLNNALADGSIYNCFSHRALKDKQIETFNKEEITEFRVVEFKVENKKRIVKD